MKKVAIVLSGLLVVLVGCSLEPLIPSDWSSNYYAQYTADSTYFVIKIFTDTSGEVYEYNRGADPDDRTDDNLVSINSFTITIGPPWHFTGGALDNDVYSVGLGELRNINFDGEASAYFPASGTSYP